MPGMQGANVETVDALKDLRLALIRFHERTLSAMGDLRQKIDRTMAWLELDRPNYWKEQERRAYDLVASTRVALETCRLRTVAGRRPDCIEEKKAFEKAKFRMEYVREKQHVVQKWVVQTGKETNEYRARTSSFQRMLEHDVPLMIAQLDRMIDAIEAYADARPGHLTSSTKADSTPAANPDVATSDAVTPAVEDTVALPADPAETGPRSSENGSP